MYSGTDNGREYHSESTFQLEFLEGTRVLSVCPFAKYTFPPLDSFFSPILLLPYVSVGQLQFGWGAPSSGGNKCRATARSLNDLP
jgi:hypothetical protein